MTYSKRDVNKIMKKNGFYIDQNRGKGSHIIYRRGNRIISIGDHYNKMVIQRLIKENDLVV